MEDEWFQRYPSINKIIHLPINPSVSKCSYVQTDHFIHPINQKLPHLWKHWQILPSTYPSLCPSINSPTHSYTNPPNHLFLSKLFYHLSSRNPSHIYPALFKSLFIQLSRNTVYYLVKHMKEEFNCRLYYKSFFLFVKTFFFFFFNKKQL